MNKAYLAEFLGTFILVLVGVGSVVISFGSIGVVGVSVAFGLALIGLYYTIEPISGCHVNPAVTLGIAASRGMRSKDIVGYIVAQLLGATVAALIIYPIAIGAPGGYNLSQGLGSTGYGSHSLDGYNVEAAAVVEAILTFILVLVVLSTTDKKRDRLLSWSSDRIDPYIRYACRNAGKWRLG